MSPLEQCLDEQRQARDRLAQPNLTAMERFLYGLWLQDWVKEELILRREVWQVEQNQQATNS